MSVRRITVEEKDWLDNLDALCQEHVDKYGDIDYDEAELDGLTNLCTAIIFSHTLIDFSKVERPTLH
jgi:hypothetical protein